MTSNPPQAQPNKARVARTYERVSVVENLIRLYEVHGRIAVTEILADLRHYCDHQKYDFAELDQEAYTKYVSELRGNEHD